MPSRPLSPHLSVYKFKYTLTTSILNRFTGVILSAGFLVLCFWLMAVASGAAAQARAQRICSGTPMKLLYLGLIFAFAYHLLAGIRHLVWDTGTGLERSQSRASAYLLGVASVVLTLAIAWLLWGRTA
jgi:succinate dehydrogenase / fumarate reductase, cytochrome b subunit